MTTTELTQSLQQIVSEAKIAGLNVAIISQNKLVYQQAFGTKDARHKTRLDTETVQYAASFTKPMFAFLFLKLVEKGIFDLDKPIFNYLKKPIGAFEKFKDLAHEPQFERITARMILSHTSGLPILRMLYRDSLYCIAEPTTKLFYSNEAYNFLGFVVEDWTGRDLQSWANELIFTPLSMRRTGMVWQTDFDKNCAGGHDAKGEYLGIIKKTNARAAGSAVTTPTDYAQFLAAIMDKKGLSDALFSQMMTPQYFVQTLRGFGNLRDSFSKKYTPIQFAWGLGFAQYQSPFGKDFFHTGHTDGWQNLAIAFPEHQIAVVLMSNSDNFEPVADKILSAAVGNVAAPLEWFGYFDGLNN